MPLPPPAPPLPQFSAQPSAPGVRSRVNEDVFEFFSRCVPRLKDESYKAFRERVLRDPALLMKVEKAMREAPMSEQIKLVAMRRMLAVAGGQRVTGSRGPNNQALSAPMRGAHFGVSSLPARPRTDGRHIDARWDHAEPSQLNQAPAIAQRYDDDLRQPHARAKFAKEMISFLDTAFQYESPKDGSIFWTGVDPDKLARQVNLWNKKYGDELFAQLEATSDARYINGGFDYTIWENDKRAAIQPTEDYFTAVSERYGSNATGHVTAVQLWGLRAGSVFENAEFPTLLKHMADDIKARREPRVQDITIVVFDPLSNEASNYKMYTNYQIAEVPIWKKKDSCTKRFPENRKDVEIVRYVGDGNDKIPMDVRRFWLNRGQVEPAKAARAIATDYALIKRT